MKKYILDSNALLCFFQKENSWEKVADFLKRHLKGEIELKMSVINYGEFVYILKTRLVKTDFQNVISQFNILAIELIDADLSQVETAADYKSLGGIAYPDCFVLSLAKKYQANIITGDKEFQKFESEFKIEWLE